MRKKIPLLVLLIIELSLSACASKEDKLFAALQQGNYKIANQLIAEGANPMARDEKGRTPLHYSEDVAISRLLIEQGADVNAMGTEKKLPFNLIQKDYAPLHLISSSAVAELLLTHQANVNILGRYGETPLHKARSLNMVKLLLKNGADINKQTPYGKTPLRSFVRQAIFKKKTADDKKPVIIKVKNYEIASYLLEQGAKINLADHMGHTALHDLGWDSYKMAKLLVKHGADIHAKSKEGNTPLCYAVADNKLEHIKLYFRHGADIYSLCEKGDDLVAYAEKRNASKKTITFLKELKIFIRKVKFGERIQKILDKVELDSRMNSI